MQSTMPAQRFRIEVSAEELDVIAQAIGRTPKATAVRGSASSPADTFAPSTGIAELDDFMRRHHDPRWKPPALPRPGKVPALTPAQRTRIEAQWNEAAKVAWGRLGVTVEVAA